MTDNEIIKALKCCGNYNDCDKCDFEPKDNKKKTIGCCLETMKNALDLITRQQAEIERLKKENEILSKNADTAFQEGLNESQDLYAEQVKAEIKSEAYKEFAKRVKDVWSDNRYDSPDIEFDYFIDSIVKEMVGENNE